MTQYIVRTKYTDGDIIDCTLNSLESARSVVRDEVKWELTEWSAILTMHGVEISRESGDYS